MTGSCAVSEGGDIMIEIWGGGTGVSARWEVSTVGNRINRHQEGMWNRNLPDWCRLSLVEKS